MTLTDHTLLAVSRDKPQRFGRYLLLELLSDHVESRLFRAIHQRLQKQVALRLLGPKVEDEAPSREKHLDECRVLCHLLHPNLVRIETAGEHEGTLYVVMEFAAGVDLQTLKRSIGSMSLADACQLTGQAAMGLRYLHEQNLAHGRIRLENLVLTASGRLKIVGLEQTRHDSSQADFISDLRGLALALRELLSWEDSEKHDGLPPDLASVLLGFTADQTPYSKQSLQEFIAIAARRSIGSDLHALLTQVDITPEAGSNDSLMSERRVPGVDHEPEPPAARRTQFQLRHVLALLIVLSAGLGAAIVGSNWWVSDTNKLALPHSSTPAEPGRSNSRGDSRDIAEEFATSDPDWDSPATNPSTQDLHHPIDPGGQVLGLLDPDRDAFDLQVHSTNRGTEFTNLDSRGIVQFPLIMPERFTLECTVERLEGEGSFGFAFSAGEARLMALLDHEVENRWQSGMYFVDSNGKSGILNPSSKQLLVKDAPIRLSLTVAPEHVELRSADRANDYLPDGQVSSWSKSDEAVSQPSLGRSDAYYPQTFFVHTYRGAFRVHDLQILNASADPVPQTFHGSEAPFERRLAQRIVWRGGHVEIITETSTRTVHRLQELTDDPWLTGVEKCPSATRLMIGDAELSELTRINGIRKLDLSDSQVTAEAIPGVAGLRSLNFLALPRHGIDGSVLASLRDLPALRQLQLIDVSLDDDDLNEIVRFPQLTSLCLAGCPITDAGVANVARMLPELEHLCLSGTRITGECLAELSTLRSLKDLQLHQTAVDDNAIANLSSLPQLQKLTLAETNVSSTAIERLREKRPGLEIK